jgi:hypothetical protein
LYATIQAHRWGGVFFCLYLGVYHSGLMIEISLVGARNPGSFCLADTGG